MDLIGALIYRVGKLSVPLKADLQWRRSRHRDYALMVVERLVSPGTTAVDVGAGWGLFTNQMARRVGQRGSVHAFEPNPSNASSLAAIAKRQPQVSVHELALSGRSGHATLRVPTINDQPVVDMGTLADTGFDVATEVTVRTVRLDDVLEAPVAFMKVDVEGHELSVLEGAENVIGGHTTLLIEVEQRHHKEPISGVLDRLTAYGKVEAVFPDGLRPLSAFDAQRDQIEVLRRKVSPAEGEPAEYIKDFLIQPT